jgi:hypothetical protein
LVIVANDAEITVFGGQQADDAVLGVIGVLVLIDQNVAEFLLIIR